MNVDDVLLLKFEEFIEASLNGGVFLKIRFYLRVAGFRVERRCFLAEEELWSQTSRISECLIIELAVEEGVDREEIVVLLDVELVFFFVLIDENRVLLVLEEHCFGLSVPR